jgi:hypothetical protein
MAGHHSQKDRCIGIGKKDFCIQFVAVLFSQTVRGRNVSVSAVRRPDLEPGHQLAGEEASTRSIATFLLDNHYGFAGFSRATIMRHALPPL